MGIYRPNALSSNSIQTKGKTLGVRQLENRPILGMLAEALGANRRKNLDGPLAGALSEGV